MKNNIFGIFYKGLFTAVTLSLLLIGFQNCSQPMKPITDSSERKTSSVIRTLMDEGADNGQEISDLQRENEYDLAQLKLLEKLEAEGELPSEEQFGETPQERFSHCRIKLHKFEREAPSSPEVTSKSYHLLGRGGNEFFYVNGVLEFKNISGILYTHGENAISYDNVRGISYATANRVAHLTDVRGIHNILADKIGDITTSMQSLPVRPTLPKEVLEEADGVREKTSEETNTEGSEISPHSVGAVSPGEGETIPPNPTPRGLRQNRGIFCLEAYEISKLDGFRGIATLVGKNGTGRIEEIKNFRGILHVENMDIGSLSNFRGILHVEGGKVDVLDSDTVRGIVDINP